MSVYVHESKHRANNCQKCDSVDTHNVSSLAIVRKSPVHVNITDYGAPRPAVDLPLNCFLDEALNTAIMQGHDRPKVKTAT